MRWFFNTVFLVFLSVLPAAAEEQADSNGPENMTVTHYVCERNVEIPVVYIQTRGPDSYAVMYVEGKLVPMRQEVSASGAIYYAVDEQNSYRWYTKGDEAFLGFLEADHTAEEKILLSSCKAVDE